MPSTKVEFRHGYETLYGVVDCRDRKHGLRMCHEAVSIISTCVALGVVGVVPTHFVIRSSMDRGSKMKVGRVTRLKSAPGRSCDMICMSTVNEFLR